MVPKLGGVEKRINLGGKGTKIHRPDFAYRAQLEVFGNAQLEMTSNRYDILNVLSYKVAHLGMLS